MPVIGEDEEAIAQSSSREYQTLKKKFLAAGRKCEGERSAKQSRRLSGIRSQTQALPAPSATDVQDEVMRRWNGKEPLVGDYEIVLTIHKM